MSDYTAEEIASAIADMQANGATNEQIAQAAADAGVSVSEIAAATGASEESISQVFSDAGIAPAPEPAPAPAYEAPAPAYEAPAPEPTPEPVQPPAYQPPAPQPAPVAPTQATAPQPQAVQQQAAAPVAPAAPNPMSDAVNAWFQQNANATPAQVMAAIQSAGGLTPEIAAAVGAHYGTDATAVQDYYTANMPAPTQPAALDNTKAANQPVAPTPSANLSAYDPHTQAAVKTAGLDSVMSAVGGNANLADIVKSGLTPSAVDSYKDATGQMVKAAPNTFSVTSPDGSGGALNYFFTVDPKTGVTAPINNASQNLTYTAGSSGSVLGGLFHDVGDIVKTVAPIALNVALIANGIPPWQAGAITGAANAAVNGGSLTDIAKAGLAGGAAGYVGEGASNAVGTGAPITSGAAGGAAAGATNAALTGQNIGKGVLTGGVIGGGAGALGLSSGKTNGPVIPDSANNLINSDLADIIKVNPGATAEQIAKSLSVSGWSSEEISGALGADNPIAQAAANPTPAAPTTPVAPYEPSQASWAKDLYDAWTNKDESVLSNIIRSNNLSTDDIMQAFKLSDPNSISVVNDAVNTAYNTAPTTTTGGGTTNINPETINITAPKLTNPTAPVVPITGGGVPNTKPETINITAPKLTEPTKPVVPVTTPDTSMETVVIKAPPLTPPTPPLVPLTPVTIPPTVVPPTVVAHPPTTPEPPTVVPPTPPVVPIVNTTKPTQTSVGPTTLPPTVFGTSPVGQVNTGAGYLNPGLIQAQTYYKNNTSPVQAQYYWGAHPFQTGGINGQTFDPILYNQVPGGTHPWGLQQMGTALTTAQLQALLNGQNITPGVVAGPVAP